MLRLLYSDVMRMIDPTVFFEDIAKRYACSNEKVPKQERSNQKQNSNHQLEIIISRQLLEFIRRISDVIRSPDI